MREINALIADDEPLARTNLREALGQFPHWRIVREIAAGDQVVPACEELAPDVVFLDIEMPGQNGVEVARALASLARCPQVVFVTAFDSYAVEAFELSALDYLLKPFDDTRFANMLERVERSVDAQAQPQLEALATALSDPDRRLDRLLIRSVGSIRIVPMDEVLWFAAGGNYVEVHHRAGVDLHRIGLSALEKRLDARIFCRVHRSAIVRVSEVRELRFNSNSDAWVAIMADGSEVRVSMAHREALLQRLGEPS